MSNATWLSSTWTQLVEAGASSLVTRIPDSVHFAQFCALDHEGRFVYYTDSDEKPEMLTELVSITVSVQKTFSGKWRRSIVLLDDEYFDEFSRLIELLMQAATSASTEKTALRTQFAEYERWLSFYEKRRAFSMSAARGLFGELLTLLEERASRGQTWRESIESWQGPAGAPQDFIFDGLEAIEVKTINVSTKRITINGAEQLEFDGSLTLRVRKLSAARLTDTGETLSDLVRRISEDMPKNDATSFKGKLAEAGYDPDSEFSIDWVFKELGASDYTVSGSFPRIQGSNLPSAITGVEYQIHIGDIEVHKKR